MSDQEREAFEKWRKESAIPGFGEFSVVEFFGKYMGDCPDKHWIVAYAWKHGGALSDITVRWMDDEPGAGSKPNGGAEPTAKYWADWLIDAVSASTQDRRLLKGDPEYEYELARAIELNGEKAILSAIKKYTQQSAQECDCCGYAGHDLAKYRKMLQDATPQQPAQSDGEAVPEGWIFSNSDDAREFLVSVCSPEYSRYIRHSQKLAGDFACHVASILSAAPQQPAQGWIKCSERLPTEADADWDDQVWGYEPAAKSAIYLWDWWDAETSPTITHWMPTGLKRPAPPTGGE